MEDRAIFFCQVLHILVNGLGLSRCGKEIMELVDYIKPELAAVSVVLYFLGVGIKKSGLTDCKYIPLINGAAGILICMLYVFAVSSVEGGKDVALAIFTGLTQGVMAAGLSTYVHQMIKQMRGTGENQKPKGK